MVGNNSHRLALFLLSLCYGITCDAQSYYVSEIAEDHEPWEISGFLEIIDIITFAIIIFFVLLMFFLVFIPSKRDDRKAKAREEKLKEMAKSILTQGWGDPLLRRINENKVFQGWFIRGYMLGVNFGKDSSLKERNWKNMSEDILGGDRDFCQRAYEKGIEFGDADGDCPGRVR